MLFSTTKPVEPSFLKIFKYSFPIVDIKRQIAEINPDLIYVHNLKGIYLTKSLLETGKTIIRFFHDHRLFCLRTYKYTFVKKRTCTLPIGLNCYRCLGFINKSAVFPKIRFSFLGSLIEEQNINKQMSAFIVGSKYMKNHLALHKFPENKIKVLPLFFSKSINKTDNEKRENNLLIFVGQLITGKGLDIIIKAMSRIKNTNCRLVICGSGKQEDKFKSMTRKLNLHNIIEFKGDLTYDELASIYESASCLLIASRAETFGLSGVEAMAHSLPVIAIETGGISDWLKNGVNGISVPIDDIDAYAVAIDTMLDNREEAIKMGERGYTYFIEKFQPQTHIDSLAKLIFNLVEKEKNNASE